MHVRLLLLSKHLHIQAKRENGKKKREKNKRKAKSSIHAAIQAWLLGRVRCAKSCGCDAPFLVLLCTLFGGWSHAQRPGTARRLLALVTAPWFPGPVAAADWLAATLGVMHGALVLTDFTELHVVCDKEQLLI